MSASKYHRVSGLLSAERGRTANDDAPEADALGQRGIQDGDPPDAKPAAEPAAEREYLDYANQCGYLLKNVTLNFLRSTRMHGVSVKTKIKDLVPYQLRDFTGADGGAPLASLSTHKDTKLEKSGRDTWIYSGFSGFALAIVDFLDAGIDVEAIAAKHRESGGGPKYQPLDKWGVSRKAILERLVSQRPDIDAEAIRKSFMKGHDGKLSIGGSPAIKVRF